MRKERKKDDEKGEKEYLKHPLSPTDLPQPDFDLDLVGGATNYKRPTSTSKENLEQQRKKKNSTAVMKRFS